MLECTGFNINSKRMPCCDHCINKFIEYLNKNKNNIKQAFICCNGTVMPTCDNCIKNVIEYLDTKNP